MRRLLPFVLFCLGAVPTGQAESGLTALEAVKVLPSEVSAQLAVIQAFDGQPAPERWHILVHDAREETGLHEYVVAGGEVVASRAISQFAEELKPEDVIGARNVMVDSDRAARLAQLYATANRVTAERFQYELRRDPVTALPLWRVTCLGHEGENLGRLIVTADRGLVLSHQGFPLEPSGEKPKPEKAKPEAPEKPKADKPKTERASEKPRSEPSEKPKSESAEKTKPEPKRATPAPRVREAEAATPPPETESRPGLFRRAGGSLQHIFTGRESSGR